MYKGLTPHPNPPHRGEGAEKCTLEFPPLEGEGQGGVSHTK